MDQLHGRTCMNAMHKGLLASALAAAACLSTPVVAQEPPPPPAEMTDLQWQRLEKQINDRANETANSQKFFEDDRRPIVVKTRLDRPSKVLILEIDRSFSKDVGSLELEDFMSHIRVGMEDLTGLISGFTTTEWIIGGHDMDYWFNEVDPESIRPDTPEQVSTAQTARPKVVVAAGHGTYFHQKLKWTTQRDWVNGVLEDEITTVFAKELSFFTERNGADPIRIRGADVGLIHQPSGKPWNSLAARYTLKNWRPDRPEI